MKADSGKSIPLVPGTSTPHKCPEKEVVHDFDKTKESPPERDPQQIDTNENLKKTLERKPLPGDNIIPRTRDFDEEVTKAEVKRISVWARFEANSINFPEDFDKDKATTDALRARQIDRNVDKKDLMHYYFYVKYGQKKDSVDNLP